MGGFAPQHPRILGRFASQNLRPPPKYMETWPSSPRPPKRPNLGRRHLGGFAPENPESDLFFGIWEFESPRISRDGAPLLGIRGGGENPFSEIPDLRLRFPYCNVKSRDCLARPRAVSARGGPTDRPLPRAARRAKLPFLGEFGSQNPTDRPQNLQNPGRSTKFPDRPTHF